MKRSWRVAFRTFPDFQSLKRRGTIAESRKRWRVGWHFKSKAIDRLAGRNKRGGLKLPSVEVKGRNKMNKRRPFSWGFFFPFSFFYHNNAFFMVSLRDKEYGGWVYWPEGNGPRWSDPSVERPPSLGLVYVIVINNDMLLFYLRHHHDSVICYCLYTCYC